VRRGGLVGFGDLQECHDVFLLSVV
jgi:hypothetical protein